MSKSSIPRRRKSRNWRKHLSTQRRIDTYNASMEVVKVEARLEMRLSPAALDEIEARWQALPDLDACFPQQRLAFLLREETRLVDAAAGRVIASIERQARMMV